MKRNSLFLLAALLVFLIISSATLAQALDGPVEGTSQPNLDAITGGGSIAGFGPEVNAVDADKVLEETDVVIPGADNDVIAKMSAAGNSSAMSQAFLGQLQGPLAIQNSIMFQSDPQIAAANNAATQISQTAAVQQQLVVNGKNSGRGGQGSPSDDSQIMGDIAWLSWEDCIKAEQEKLKEKYNIFDAYAACGGGSLQGKFTFDHVPGWAESKEILKGFSYIDASGKKQTVPDNEMNRYMRLSQFLFGRNLVNTDSLKGSKLTKQEQAQKDAIESFSSFIGDLIFKVEEKNNAHYVTRWNLTEFKTRSGSSGSYEVKKLIPRPLWVFNRTQELFNGLMKGMHTECIGGVRMSGDGSGDLKNFVLDKNPFEVSSGDNDAYQAYIEQQKEDIYKRLLKVNGYIVKQDIVSRLFLMWLSRRSQNPLNPDCTELSENDGSVPMAYAPPQPVEFRVYDTNPDPKKTIEENKAARKKAEDEYNTWRKANGNFINPEERRLLLTLAYNMAATDFYGQLVSAYNFINRAPSGSAVSGTIRSAGIKLVLKQAGAENLAGIQEMQTRHLKAIEEVTRQLNGDLR